MSDVVVLVKARLQAGETVRQAVRHVAPQLPQPVRTEWQRLVDRLDAGYAFSEAIAALVDQVPDRDVAAVLHQLHVYDRDSVPPDPFGTLAAHLSRMKLVKRDYVVRRATSAITVYTGVAFFVAMVSMLGPTLYGLWVNSVGSMPL
jgi:pilus assembly protein TadC